jgi:hypothetical protein
MLRSQLREAEAQLQWARARLGGAKAGGEGEEKKITLMIREADGKTRTIEVPSGADVLRRIEDVLRHVESKTGADVKKRIEIEAVPGTQFSRPQPGRPGTPPTPPPAGAAPRSPFAPVPPGGPGDARLRDLEKKLEMLMKEMESLRRELKPPRPGEGPRGGPTRRDERPSDDPNRGPRRPGEGSREGSYTEVIFIGSLGSSEVVKTLTGMFGTDPTKGAPFIWAEPTSNRIYIRGTAEQVDDVKAAIRTLLGGDYGLAPTIAR